MSEVGVLQRWKAEVKRLKRSIRALAFAARDPRTPWYARVLAIGVVAYALSPIDLIPDPIPVLGYLDDLILLPLGIWATLRLIPADVWTESLERAETEAIGVGKASWVAAFVIVVLWLIALLGVIWWVAPIGRSRGWW